MGLFLEFHHLAESHQFNCETYGSIMFARELELRDFLTSGNFFQYKLWNLLLEFASKHFSDTASGCNTTFVLFFWQKLVKSGKDKSNFWFLTCLLSWDCKVMEKLKSPFMLHKYLIVKVRNRKTNLSENVICGACVPSEKVSWLGIVSRVSSFTVTQSLWEKYHGHRSSSILFVVAGPDEWKENAYPLTTVFGNLMKWGSRIYRKSSGNELSTVWCVQCCSNLQGSTECTCAFLWAKLCGKWYWSSLKIKNVLAWQLKLILATIKYFLH